MAFLDISNGVMSLIAVISSTISKADINSPPKVLTSNIIKSGFCFTASLTARFVWEAIPLSTISSRVMTTALFLEESAVIEDTCNPSELNELEEDRETLELLGAPNAGKEERTKKIVKESWITHL